MKEYIVWHRYRTFLFGLIAVFVAENIFAQDMSSPSGFSVDATGAAQYTIPIRLRSNPGGIVPDLNLKYNSQGGNGLLGMGWSLSGFSEINRCAKTMAQDGVNLPVLDNTDGLQSPKFCMDGRRLITNPVYDTPGYEYKTFALESDDFTTIRAPVSYFSLGTEFNSKTKDGLKKKYTGITIKHSTPNPEDGTPLYDGSVNVFWPISAIEDKFGNKIQMSYLIDALNVAIVPNEITYASVSGGQRLASFEYEIRPDVISVYREGALNQTTKRISKIFTYAQTADLSEFVLKEYRIAYGQEPATLRSRIASITECNNIGVCLPPVTITYAASTAAKFSATLQSGIIDWGSASGRDWVDVDGDGKADFCRVVGAIGSSQLACTLSTGTGFGNTVLSGNIDPGVDVSRKWIDVNGDGKADFCRVIGTAGAYQLSCILGSATGFGGIVASAIDPGNELGNAVWSDKWADGRQRYCRFDSAANFTCAVLQGGSFVDTAMGGKGAGKFDLVEFIGGGLLYRCGVGVALIPCVSLMNYPTYETGMSPLATSAAGWWADVNGDGRQDYCQVRSSISTGGFSCSLSKGISGAGAQLSVNFVSFGTLDYGLAAGRKMLDVNGDGNADYCRVIGAAGAYKVACTFAPSTAAFGVSVTSDVIDPGLDTSRGWADITGTGEQSMCRLVGTTNMLDSRIACTTLLVGTSGATKFSNGLGRDTTITYKPLTDPGVYTRDADAVYPLADVVQPFYLVSNVETSDGIGGTRKSSYSYGGFKTDKSGRGGLGARWTQSTQLDTGMVTRTEYRQDWPFTGSPVLVTTSLPGKGHDGLLSRSTYTYGCSDYVNTVGCTVAMGKRYSTFQDSSKSEKWDLDGSALPSLSISTKFDVWGNPVQIDSLTSDGFGTTTNNTFVNRAAIVTSDIDGSQLWQIGQLVKSVVTRTTP